MKNSIIPILAALPCATLSAAVVYEPFEDSDSTLNGNAVGDGLQGTWNGGAGALVTPGSLSFGSSPTSGNKLEIASGTSTTVELNNDLANAGLLDDGSSLWFSYLVDVDSSSSTNDQTGFSFGTAGLGTGNNLTMNGGGSGIGVFLQRGSRLKGASWDSAIDFTGPNNGVSPAGPAALIVGRIDWGATAADDDMISLFLPGTDRVLPAAPHAVHNAGTLDQSTFDTISISRKNGSGGQIQIDRYDEISFSADFQGLSVIPEPSSRLIFGLGAFGLMVTRRARRTR